MIGVAPVVADTRASPGAARAQAARQVAIAGNGGRIGILSGGGRLPLMIAESLAARGIAAHIVAIQGEAGPDIERFPHTWVNWGQIGRMVATLKSEGGGEMVIAGSVTRPDLWKLRMDLGFFQSLPQILGLLVGGDDSVLSRVVRFFEAKGLTVHGAHEVAPDLLAGAGALGSFALTAETRRDAALAFAVGRVLGPLDAGQAVVAAGGEVVAIEGAEGTDAMLRRVADLRRDPSKGRGGVLAKGPKPGQELRVDMPAIGPRTVEMAAEARLAGIAAQAGAVLLLDRAEAVRIADDCAIALEGVVQPEPERVSAMGARGMTAQVVGRLHPNGRGRVDAAKGLAAVIGLAPYRTGAAVVVARAYLLAIAAGEPVETVLDRVRALRQWGLDKRRRVGVLACRLEAADAGVDAATVSALLDRAAAQGLAGIAIAGPAAALAPFEAAARAADGRGLFLLACRLDTLGAPAQPV